MSTSKTLMKQVIHPEIKTRFLNPHEVRLTEYGQDERDTAVRSILVHDGGAALEAARRAYRKVTQNLRNHFDFREDWFQLSELTEISVAERAADVAARADIVFCCPSDPHQLPEPFQDWIQLWLERRRRADTALALLLPSPAGEESLLEEELGEIALVNGIAFFAGRYTAGPQGTSARGERTDQTHSCLGMRAISPSAV